MKIPIKYLFIVFFFATVSVAQDSAEEVLWKHKQSLFGDAFQSPQSAEVQTSQSQMDALHYKIQLNIDFPNQAIIGDVTATFRVLSDSLDQIILDLKQNMAVQGISFAGINFIHENDGIKIDLDRVYLKGEKFSVAISYSGTPFSQDFGYFVFDQMPDGSPLVWTLSEPYGAKHWWPCKDTPADKADSVDIIVTVPDEQVVGSNGNLISQQDNGNGTRTFHWQEKFPIATYLVSLVSGNYAQFQEYYHDSNQDSMLLDYYVYPEYLSNAKIIFSEMHNYLDALSYYFGPYPFITEKYGMAQFGWGGGMEHQTLTSIGQVTPSWRYIYVHELGHQWFGDAVTCASWTDIWLNEGFASYSEALYAEWAGFSGFPPGFEAYQAYMLTQRWTADGTIYVADTSLVANIFNHIVYDKGSWVLHMLRHVLGDEIFFDVLKSYVTDMRWSYGSVRTEDFQTICEEKSGLNLTDFFNQWLYYPYFPIYIYSWDYSFSESGFFELSVSIKQDQTGIIYNMPIDINIQFQDSDTTIVVSNNTVQQKYTFQVERAPALVTVDPQHWILREVYLNNAQSYSPDLIIRKTFPNPFKEHVNIQISNWAPKPPLVEVFDVRGRKVKILTLMDKALPVFFYEWDGKNSQGKRVSSGVYFIKAESLEGNAQVSKIIKLN